MFSLTCVQKCILQYTTTTTSHFQTNKQTARTLSGDQIIKAAADGWRRVISIFVWWKGALRACNVTSAEMPQWNLQCGASIVKRSSETLCKTEAAACSSHEICDSVFCFAGHSMQKNILLVPWDYAVCIQSREIVQVSLQTVLVLCPPFIKIIELSAVFYSLDVELQIYSRFKFMPNSTCSSSRWPRWIRTFRHTQAAFALFFTDAHVDSF